MQRLRPPSESLTGLVPYDPKYLPARVYLNANESPYGLPGQLQGELVQALFAQSLNRYPDPLAKSLRAQIAEAHEVQEGCVLLGNGGDELLFDIMLAYGGYGRKLLTAPPSFSSYELFAKITGTEMVEIGRTLSRVPITAQDALGDEPLALATLKVDEQAVLDRVSQGDIDIVMLASPNNPTGDVLGEEFIISLLDASDAVVLIDQAYIEFAEASVDMRHLLSLHENLVILRTFSKAYALAGIRLGYLLASKDLVSELCKVRQPYSVDAFSALAGSVVIRNQEAFTPQIAESISERKRVMLALAKLPGVTVYASEANFVLINVTNAHIIWQRLFDEQGILLRDFSSAPGLTDCLRLSIGTPEENDELLDSLGRLLVNPNFSREAQ